MCLLVCNTYSDPTPRHSPPPRPLLLHSPKRTHRAAMPMAASLLLPPLLLAALVQPCLAVNGRPETQGTGTTNEECSRSLSGQGEYTLSLHIAAIFVVFVSSSIGVTLPFVPIWTKGRFGNRRGLSGGRQDEELDDDSDDHGHSYGHSHAHAMPSGWWDEVFFVSKYFGAGVIVATAFVHLIYEAFIQLTSPCIKLAFAPTAPAISMASLFLIFVVDLLLMRHIHRSTKAMKELKARRAKDKACIDSSQSIQASESMATTDDVLVSVPNTPASPPALLPSGTVSGADIGEKRVDAATIATMRDREQQLDQEEREADAKLAERVKELDVLVIEGGIVFHSVMVGLGLGTAPDAGFVPYFIAIVFHQMFDGFAIGTRMAALNFEKKRKKQIAMFLAYAFVTPVGIALGTGVRTVFEPNDPTTIIAIGVLDSLSAGVLLYGALVDMLAKDFLFGPMLDASDVRLSVALVSLLFGAGVMSLMGKWA
ncbi:hypothetical protein ACQY0O_007365 [Thecaphora frezii]